MCSTSRHGECGTPAGRTPRSFFGSLAMACSKVRWAPPPRSKYRTCSRMDWSLLMPGAPGKVFVLLLLLFRVPLRIQGLEHRGQRFEWNDELRFEPVRQGAKSNS